MNHPLHGAFARTQRAAEHIEALRVHIRDFAETERRAIVAQMQAGQTDELKHDLEKTPPPIISILLGETIYNLRAALDYLIYALAWANSGSPQQGTQFPIVDCEKDFAKVSKKFLKGLNTAHVAKIENLQPYKGCDWTRQIRDLSNPDKHRHLHGVIPRPFGLFGQWGLPQCGGLEDMIHPDVTLDDRTSIVPTLNLLQAEVFRTLQEFYAELKTVHCPHA